MRAPMSRFRTALVAVVVAVLFLGTSAAVPAPARADERLPERTTGVVVKGGQLMINVGLQDLFGPAERQHLTTGFSTRILIRVALQDAARDETIDHELAIARRVGRVGDLLGAQHGERIVAKSHRARR